MPLAEKMLLPLANSTALTVNATAYHQFRQPALIPPRSEARQHRSPLADLGYEGEADTIVVAFKNPANSRVTDPQQTFNRARNRLRAIGERGNNLLKTGFKALRNVSLCPWKIGAIVAEALVILHIEHNRTT